MNASLTTPARDWTLKSGERQVGATLAEIRGDHLARYQWAIDLIPLEAQLGLDVFCGIGYGTQLLAHNISGAVLGIDGSAEAIAFAEDHYANDRTLYARKRYPFTLPQHAFDFVVCFESTEHVGDGYKFLDAIRRAVKIGGLLFLSTPNETRMPRAQFNNPFHVRHYTREEILSLMPNMEIVEWHGQLVDEREHGILRAAEAEADYLVFAFRRTS